jgi:hypothetical protein
MRITIQFNHQVTVMAEKIGNIVTQHMLATEFPAIYLPV